MSKKVQLYLDEETYTYLEQRSQRERRKPGNLAALWVVERIEAERKQAESQLESK